MRWHGYLQPFLPSLCPAAIVSMLPHWKLDVHTGKVYSLWWSDSGGIRQKGIVQYSYGIYSWAKSYDVYQNSKAGHIAAGAEHGH
ncbi:hypothetical protein Hypma_013213 [Hypsizygus marmoreus]|uniref:Uncharacterized protein n=1 Tax=Hypsizygus marmoreus TaxID=39966 RepID=A0A369JES3_HYPMA|nr:hypothetical protein Hypma_013213 [Hypsizygus marmoreus]